MALNGQLLKRHRIERRLSPTHAAAIAEISPRTLKRIENNDPKAAHMITCAGLIQLAHELELRPAELLRTPDTAQPNDQPTTPSKQDQEDAEVLIGLLLDLKAIVTRSEVRHSLGWPSHRLNAAVDTADTQLRGSGIHLHKTEDNLRLRPTEQATVTETLQNLTITRHDKRGMDSPTARTLYNIYQGTHTPGGRSSIRTHTVTALLIKTGAAEQQGTNTFLPSSALRYALED